MPTSNVTGIAGDWVKSMIFVLLPAFNEADSLPKLLPKIRGALGNASVPYRVLVCDDGSSDDTAKVLVGYANVLPLEVITHKINRGLGETARDLFELAAELAAPGDVVVRLDCDDTHDPALILRMVSALDERDVDVIIASRFQPGGGQVGVGSYRGFVSRAANLFMKVFFPVPGVREFSCGYRAYRAEVIQKAIAFYGNQFIQLKGLGFTGTLEKLVKLHILGARFGEIPFVLQYDQKVSDSKMVSSITTLGYLVMTVLYHWPWGGWRRGYRKRLRAADSSLIGGKV